MRAGSLKHLRCRSKVQRPKFAEHRDRLVCQGTSSSIQRQKFLWQDRQPFGIILHSLKGLKLCSLLDQRYSLNVWLTTLSVGQPLDHQQGKLSRKELGQDIVGFIYVLMITRPRLVDERPQGLCQLAVEGQSQAVRLEGLQLWHTVPRLQSVSRVRLSVSLSDIYALACDQLSCGAPDADAWHMRYSVITISASDWLINMCSHITQAVQKSCAGTVGLLCTAKTGGNSKVPLPCPA